MVRFGLAWLGLGSEWGLIFEWFEQIASAIVNKATQTKSRKVPSDQKNFENFHLTFLGIAQIG